MRHFPQSLATPQDVENIKNHHPEFHTQLKEHLQRTYDEPDKTTIVTSCDTDPISGEMINIVTKKVEKDKMKYKELGFDDKVELKKIIEEL